ncbi:MAG TPA: hypothetical protein VK550_33345 [Polyangiaceae bacterium]|nr:hypothetical protein [Polyangiaceae bacterium]
MNDEEKKVKPPQKELGQIGIAPRDPRSAEGRKQLCDALINGSSIIAARFATSIVEGSRGMAWPNAYNKQRSTAPSYMMLRRTSLRLAIPALQSPHAVRTSPQGARVSGSAILDPLATEAHR